MLLAAIACLTQCGCLAIYSKQPVLVRVVDAETGQEIEGATVDVSYVPKYIDLIWGLTLNRPENEHRRTDQDGSVNVPVANFGWISWSVHAEGYLGRSEMTFDGGRVPKNFLPDLAFEKVLLRSAVIRLYRGPLPRVTVVVPDGYQGPLFVHVRPVDRRVQGKPGQREFVFDANERGYVGIDATSLLIDELLLTSSFSRPSSIRARYASGAAIPDASADDDEVALRWMTVAPPGQHVFVVGTKAEEDRLHPRIYQYINGDPSNISDFEAIDKLFADAAGKALVASRSAHR